MIKFIEGMQYVFNTFGSTVFVPIMLFFVAKVLKTQTQKAFMSALMAGVALCGFSYITGGYGPYISGIVNTLVQDTGIALTAVDMGWQATAAMAYSTTIGMIYVLVGILLQAGLYLVGWTPIFMPTDLWNNYSFIIWGSFVYLQTGSMALAMVCMILQNMYVLLFAEVIQKRWETYYGYPGTVMTAPHHIAHVPLIILLDWIMNKIGLDRINFRPEAINKRLGFLGDPMTIGFIAGILIGIVGNIYRLNSLDSWGAIMKFAIATAATMAIFPRVGNIFAQAFATLTESSRGVAKSGAKDREIYIAVNDALGYGEAATLTSGLILIPISLFLSFVLPGNKIIPIMSLTSFAYRCETSICVSDGNILKAVIAQTVVLALCLWIGSYNAELYTAVAKDVGVDLGSSVLVVGMIAAMPGMFVIYWPFATKNYILMAVVIAVYVVLYFWYKKNKPVMDDFLEKNAYSYKDKKEVAA